MQHRLFSPTSKHDWHSLSASREVCINTACLSCMYQRSCWYVHCKVGDCLSIAHFHCMSTGQCKWNNIIPEFLLTSVYACIFPSSSWYDRSNRESLSLKCGLMFPTDPNKLISLLPVSHMWLSCNFIPHWYVTVRIQEASWLVEVIVPRFPKYHSTQALWLREAWL